MDQIFNLSTRYFGPTHADGNSHTFNGESGGTCDTDVSGSCQPPASASPIAKRTTYPRSMISKRVPSSMTDIAEHCCKACTDCMEASRVKNLCNDLRGGGLLVQTKDDIVATKAAEALLFNTVGGTAASTAAATPFDIPLNGWKLIFQAIITAINVIFWLVPLKHKNFASNKLGLSLANAFSGGVFLCLAFGHLIPECVHGFHEYENEALPYMIVLGGYLLIFFVEKVAFDAHGALEEMEGGSEVAVSPQKNAKGSKGIRSNDAARSDGEHSSHTGRSAVILLAALAVHSILEMTALGLSNSFNDSTLLFVSISLHQPAESIALLVAFLKSGMPRKQILRFLSVFACMGPIGVLLGMAVKGFAAPIVDAVMLAIVAGTFVYVGATEVIPEEWEDQEHKWKKFFSLITGIVSMFVITQYSMKLEGAASL
eukprot:CAMPEP_0194363644 /NCGR_PEP_ID=MMETSP0174-20130528/11484_1 /TAXON_ID=216777 /ORGANISM="Proboscia alata, Strain PI-D3" /LENGTH=427 /DNA_ID=CAMNT_0039137195 /DNA_START=369 /DNA_END=1653 /DNA_ORIENTATION=-